MITHVCRKDVRNSGVFANVNTFAEACSAITKIARKKYPLSEKDQNNFKGAAFEVLVEFFLQLRGSDAHIGFKSIESTSHDKYYVGTDFYGMTLNNTRGQIQVKFRSDPRTQLDLADLGGFFARIVAEGTDVKDILIVTNVYNTKTKSALAFVVKQLFEQQGKTVRVLGFDDLAFLCDQYKGFFDEFRETLDISCAMTARGNIEPMWAHQTRVHDAIVTVLNSADTDRGQVIVPTGGGKTRNEWEAMNYVVANNKAAIITVFAPTIELLRQIAGNFNRYGDDGCTTLHVRTGKDVERKFGEEEDSYKTTDPDDIKAAIIAAKANKKALLIYSTYASALTLVDGFNAARSDLPRVKIDLAIADEAHRLVTEGRLTDILDTEKLPVKKWIFFTATRKLAVTQHEVGMNIESLFGKVIERVLPRELFTAGVIVRPRLTFIHVQSAVNAAGDIDVEKKDLNEIAVMLKAAELHDQVRGEHAGRLLMFNSSAEDAHDFCESSVVRQALARWDIAAVSSKLARMRGVDRKTILEAFASRNRSILMQYAIVKEGIDLPGITGVAILREMNTSDTIQSIGRALRLDPADRLNLALGKITVGGGGWVKPRAEIYVLVDALDGEKYKEKVKAIVNNMRSAGMDKEDYDIASGNDPMPVGTSDPDLDIDLYGPDLSLLEFDTNELVKIHDQIWIDEETAEALAGARSLNDFGDLIYGT